MADPRPLTSKPPGASSVSPRTISPLGQFGAVELARDNADAWDNKSYVQNPMWSVSDLETLKPRWNRSYPYQLLIIDTQNGRQDVLTTFTLPISPQELSIQSPFAIDTAVTLGGVVEQHNGIPLRMITLSGTTGLLPLRGLTASRQNLEMGTPIFAGTVAGVQALQTATGQARNLITGEASAPNVIPQKDLDGPDGKTTGYYQFTLLERFLEAYALTKKTAGGRALRLAFAVWKSNAVYLVTPVAMTCIRSAASPLEYQYQLQFRAWKRIELSGVQQSGAPRPGVRRPGKMAAVLNSLDQGRRILEIGRNTMSAVRSDIQTLLLEPLRQVHLFVKDAAGAAMTAADLPAALVGDLREAILEAHGVVAGLQTFRRVPGQLNQSLDARVEALRAAYQDLALIVGKGDHGAGNPPTTGTKKQAQTGSPADKALRDPKNFYDFFSTVRPQDLNLRPQSLKAINAERDKARNLRRQDFEVLRDSALEVLADFSDSCGAGSAGYDRIYGRSTKTTTRTPTDGDWEVMSALSATAQALDSLCVTSDVNPQQTPSDYIAGLASRSGIAFQVPVSKFLAPFPYGFTLEQLAAHYLGDPNRWLEIAALNGLRAPYVDETGFQVPLPTNGSGNVISVGDASRFYTGQPVWVGSTAVRREQRRIQGIEVLATGLVRLRLDGEPDLQKFTAAAGAYVWAFLPDTVNSQVQIFIPSDRVPDDDSYEVKDIPGVDYKDPYLQGGGIDLLLDSDGDLVITPDGGCRLAIGLNNIIQRIKLAIGTPRGALNQHPEYGLGLLPGTSTADLGVDTVGPAIQNLFRGDPGISGVDAAAIQKSGNSLRLKMSVGLKATGTRIPIQVDVRL